MTKNRVLILLVLLVTSGGILYLMARPSMEAMVAERFQENKLAPDFALPDLNGNIVKLSDFRGKVVALNFWATWCGPCRKEIPDFIELQKTYGDDGLQFIGIALDEQGVSVVKPFAEKYKINYPTLIGDNDVQAKYGGMNAIPVTILIDRNGIMRGRYVGMRTKSVMESLVLPLLKEKS